MQKTNRSFAVDVLRTLSVSYIVGYWHLFDYANDYIEAIIYNSITFRLMLIALGSFVLISGYLTSKIDFQMKISKTLRYYKQRIIRIYPLYFIAVLIFYYFNISGKINVFIALTLLSMFRMPAMSTLWFVSMIVVFYLVTPIFIALMKKPWTVIVLATLILCAFIFYYELTDQLDFRIVLFFPNYILGLLLPKLRIERHKHIFRIGLLAVILSLVVSTLKIKSLVYTWLFYIPLIISGSMLIFLWIIRIEDKLPYKKVIKTISYSSYCMYLFHRPIYSLLTLIYLPPRGYLQLLYLIGICIPIMLVTSYIIQKVYDRVVVTFTMTKAKI